MEQKIGNGAWAPLAGANAVASVNPTPTSITNNCAAGPTDVNGNCTVVINSTSATTYTANATVIATVSGQTISRSTTGDPANIAAGGSGAATKIYKAGSIGDFVWWDIDKDGRQDSGEPGINDVTVRLFSNGTCTAGAGQPVQTTTTANGGTPAVDGYYNFGGLGTGTYCVEILASEFTTGGTLENWLASPKDQAPDAEDSDGDLTTRRITNISINPVSGTQDDPTNDFGFYKNSGYTLSKQRVTDPSGTGVRINEPISFTITVVNTGTTWLSEVPISDTFNTTYIQFLSASINGVNTPPNFTVTATPTETKQWTDITGSGMLAPGQSIVLVVNFVGVGDTTTLPAQAPCTAVQNACNQASTKTPAGIGPKADPDGPTGPLGDNNPPGDYEQLLPKDSNAPVKVVNPTAVALADFGAAVTPTSVTVRWTTINESEISGFDVYRIDNSRASVLIGSVAAQKPGQTAGANYSLTDSNALFGASYTYVLEAHMFSGGKESQTIANTRYVWLALTVR